MIPQDQHGNYLSSILMADHWIEPDDRENYPLIDYESGPIALNDPSEGQFYQAWTLRYFPDSGDMTLEAPNTPRTVQFNRPNINRISLAFDQNGNPFVAFVENGTDAMYWWYDPVPASTVFAALPANSLTPVCTQDDKRSNMAATGISDIILCYVLNGNLYFRQERDRFTVQYPLQSPFLHPVYELPAVLKRVGMNKSGRLQWLCDLANPLDWCNYKSEVA